VRIRSTKESPIKSKLLSAGRSCATTMAKAGEIVEEKPSWTKGLAIGGAAVRSLEALPEIVYPTIYGATGAEKEQILGVLDSLPFKHVSGVRSVRMVDSIHTHKPNWIVRGRASDLDVSNRIQLSRNALSDPAQFERTLTHEVGHTVDYESQRFRLWGERSTREPFGESPHISDYAKTNHREDFAESFEEYFADPEKLKEAAPEKYEVIKDMSEPNLLERILDREEFRETGKYMGEVFGQSETSRHVAQGAFHLSGALQGLYGAGQWIRSAQTGDSLGHAAGVLNTVSGLSFLTGLNPLIPLAVQGANQALQSSARRGTLSPEEVEAVVTAPVRPLESLFGREKTE